jgi:hypothetical protein
LTLAVLSLTLAHCGGGEDQETPPAETTGDSLSDSARLVAMVRTTVERLRYDDKSGLYEHEFQYFRDEETYDDYLGHGEVTWANADSLDSIQVVGIQIYDRDSAHLDVLYHMSSSAENPPPARPGLLTAYWHQGRWIKPYMSTLQRQLDYEELIRQAAEDSEE